VVRLTPPVMRKWWMSWVAMRSRGLTT
jgi:hypothetical protein